MRSHCIDDVSFAAYDVDTEDYYAYLPSDGSISDDEDAFASSVASKTHDPVNELTSVIATSSCIGSASAAHMVMKPIGNISGSKHTLQDALKTQKPSPSLTEGVFSIGGGKVRKVSRYTLEQHHIRKVQLQEAMAAATLNEDTMTDQSFQEAPFRFVAPLKPKETASNEADCSSASPGPVIERMEGHAPEKQQMGKRTSSATQEGDEKESDPLYDEQLDDVDEQWVQTNWRGSRTQSKQQMNESDASLCCPCCFLTVCMVCER